MREALLTTDAVTEARRGVLARLRRAWVRWLAAEAPEPDPTVGFSSREWADLPTFHPREKQ